jgi:hypothetical protein
MGRQISPIVALGPHWSSGPHRLAVGRIVSPRWVPSSGPTREEEITAVRAGYGDLREEEQRRWWHGLPAVDNMRWCGGQMARKGCLLIGGIQGQNGVMGGLHMGTQGIALSAHVRCSRARVACERWQREASTWNGRGAAHLVACACPGGSWP